jgi:hypothetical protein
VELTCLGDKDPLITNEIVVGLLLLLLLLHIYALRGFTLTMGDDCDDEIVVGLLILLILLLVLNIYALRGFTLTKGDDFLYVDYAT